MIKNLELSKRIKIALNELYSIREQNERDVRCNPDEIKEVLSILGSSNIFEIEVSRKNPNYIFVKDSNGKPGCVVKRNDIFKI